jgi:hypothetical protein
MGWMSDTQPLRSGFYPGNEQMAYESTGPKGSLTVSVELSAFDAASDMYRKLNHGLVVRSVSFIEGLECTKEEAEKLVQRLREGNPNLTLTAGWTGATHL